MKNNNLNLMSQTNYKINYFNKILKIKQHNKSNSIKFKKNLVTKFKIMKLIKIIKRIIKKF